ncbi:hypothetical protein H0H93_011071, partial [Arthromyces matolae]
MSVGLDIIDVETLDAILGRNNVNSPTTKERSNPSDIIKTDPDFAITISLLQMVDAQVLDQNIRRRLIVAMQRLAADSNIFPTCYSLDGVETNGDFPVAVGGFADVYKGTFQGQAVCIKISRVFRGSEIQSAITNAAQEIILWGQLSHPNIVPFIGFFFHKDLLGRIALVSQWMENDNVNEYLKRNPDAVRLFLALDIARGLEYLHDNDIVHGCMKGAEILVDKNGRAQISDVGVSSTLDAHMLTTELRYKSAANSNVRWLAPELLDVDGEGEPERTQKSDIYSLACLYYEIYAGVFPFAHVKREAAIYIQVIKGTRPQRPEPSSPSWIAWGLTDAMWSLITKCWAQQPALRPTSSEIASQ